MLDKELNKILDEIFEILAPGQALRSAVDRIREAGLGALVILTEAEEVKDLVEGGFELNTDFSPQKLYELSKMDGGIIVNREATKIYGANLHFQPDHNIKTDESGTRHRTAHRLAKQTSNIVVTISERRNRITIYKGEFKYTLDSIANLMAKSSQAVTSLEKYSRFIESYLNNLNYLEYEVSVTLEDILSGIRYFNLLFKMDNNLECYIRELGSEATTIKLQRDELMLGKKEDLLNLIKDYHNENIKDKIVPEKIVEKIINMEVFDDNNVMKLLGYDPKQDSLDDVLIAKGYRLLYGISKLNKRDVENIIHSLSNINNILNASYDDLIGIKGINKIKGNIIIRTKERFKRIIELEKI